MLWKPDTCGCLLTYDDNGVVVDHLIDSSGKRVDLVVCADHAGTPIEQIHDVVLAKCQAKNDVINNAAAVSGIPADSIDWSYDAKGNVVLSFDALKAEIARVQAINDLSQPGALDAAIAKITT